MLFASSQLIKPFSKRDARESLFWSPKGWALTPPHSSGLLALVREWYFIPTPLFPYPENYELKIKILAGISLYLEMLSLRLWLSFQDHFSHSSQRDREMSHLVLLCGMALSRPAHFVRLSITRHPDWDEESCYIQLPATAPMKLRGSISVWKYFNFQTLGGRVWDGKACWKSDTLHRKLILKQIIHLAEHQCSVNKQF